MKKMILITVAIFVLTAQLAWSGCDTQGCSEARPEQSEEQSVTGTTPQSEQAKPKGKARSMNLDDFATPGRAAEKDCEGSACREPGKPQVEPRSQEKKCSNANCD
ncbi:MAG TPA: hypothetical protein HPP94_15025 [Desulfuromonadales bacterium]|nr:hypothetical protein [Desulfuromonadales bacterium]